MENELTINIRGIDQFSKVFDRLEKRLRRLKNQYSKLSGKFTLQSKITGKTAGKEFATAFGGEVTNIFNKIAKSSGLSGKLVGAAFAGGLTYTLNKKLNKALTGIFANLATGYKGGTAGRGFGFSKLFKDFFTLPDWMVKLDKTITKHFEKLTSSLRRTKDISKSISTEYKSIITGIGNTLYMTEFLEGGGYKLPVTAKALIEWSLRHPGEELPLTRTRFYHNLERLFASPKQLKLFPEYMSKYPGRFTKLLTSIKTFGSKTINQIKTIGLKSLSFISANATRAFGFLKRQMGFIPSLVKGIKNVFGDMYRDVTNKIKGIAFALLRVRGPLQAIIKIAGGTAIALGAYTAGVWSFAKKIAGYGDMLERLQLRLETLTGSAEEARAIMEYFKEVAKLTPFELPQIMEAGVGLRRFGMDVQEWLIPALDLAAAMGWDLQFTVEALGKAFAGGVGAARIFRNRGILEMIRAFAKLKGITDINKLSMQEWRNLLHDYLTEEAGHVAGATKKLATTLTGIRSMISDHFSRMKEAIAKAGVYEAVKKVYLNIKSLLDELERRGTLASIMSQIAAAVNVFVVAIQDLTSGEPGKYANIFSNLMDKIIRANAHLVIFTANFIDFLRLIKHAPRGLAQKLLHSLGLGKILKVPKEAMIEFDNTLKRMEERDPGKLIERAWTGAQCAIDGYTDKLDKAKTKTDQVAETTAGLSETTATLLTTINLNTRALTSATSEYLKIAEELEIKDIEMERKVPELFEWYDQLATSFADHFANLIFGIEKDWSKALEDMLKDFYIYTIKIMTRAWILRTIFNVPLTALGPGGTLAAGAMPAFFQHGGYVTKPTLAVIGEKEPEYVIPERTFEHLMKPSVKVYITGATDETKAKIVIEGFRNLTTSQKDEIVREVIKPAENRI